MDSLVIAAARALRAGDPLRALDHVALRQDAPALALRGVAMAQLGEFSAAKALLRRAARAFGSRERLERARCATAEAEVALAARDLTWPTRALDEARRTFGALGDHDNRLHAALLRVRHLLLLGRIDEAADDFAELDLRAAPAMLVARGELVAFEIAVRRGCAGPAREALGRAEVAAARSGIHSLVAEVAKAEDSLRLPVARVITRGQERPLTLGEVELLVKSEGLIVDACRRCLRAKPGEVNLARRPILFSLLRALGEVWPEEVSREALCERTFGVRRSSESHRVRLRVEVGRLRKMLVGFADVHATPRGFRLASRVARVLVLAPPSEDSDSAIVALLSDGQPWSTSALALALNASQRTVQRALATLAAAGQVHASGSGRSQRWLAAPVGGFATTLLLPAPPGLR